MPWVDNTVMTTTSTIIIIGGCHRGKTNPSWARMTGQIMICSTPHLAGTMLRGNGSWLPWGIGIWCIRNVVGGDGDVYHYHHHVAAPLDVTGVILIIFFDTNLILLIPNNDIIIYYSILLFQNACTDSAALWSPSVPLPCQHPVPCFCDLKIRPKLGTNLFVNRCSFGRKYFHPLFKGHIRGWHKLLEQANINAA